MNRSLTAALATLLLVGFGCSSSSEVAAPGERAAMETPATPSVDVAAMEQEAVIDYLIASTNIEGQLEQLEQGFETGLGQLAGQVDSATVAQMAEAGTEAYDADALMASVRGYFEERYDDALAREAAAWFATGDYRDRTDRMRDGLDTLDMTQTPPFVESYRENPPDSAHTAKLERMVEAQRMVDFYLDTSLLMAEAMIRSAVQLMGQPVPDEQIEMMLDGLAQQATPQIEETSLAMAYRMTDFDSWDTFEADLAFYESDAGTWFSRTYSRGYRQALRDAKNRMLDAISGDEGEG